ncbi:hypothetical protein LY76DRAFT_603371 [Colletotrichum caudatum]|nr:hypothetical protein LY76DRAFT_603371 [Colletotrichum caudatum]
MLDHQSRLHQREVHNSDIIKDNHPSYPDIDELLLTLKSADMQWLYPQEDPGHAMNQGYMNGYQMLQPQKPRKQLENDDSIGMGYYHSYDTTKYPNEALYNWGQTVLWTVLEGGLGIIACSLPPLRKLVSTYCKGSANGNSSGWGRRGEFQPTSMKPRGGWYQCEEANDRSL